MMNHSSRILIALFLGIAAAVCQAQDNSLLPVVASVQPRIVKIYGSGGFRGLEPYQTGTIISPDGHILTVWSYVLDSEEVIATLNDGQKFKAKLVGYDPKIEIAILKIDATDLPSFNIEEFEKPKPGMRILAFSNLYRVATGNEPASMLRGVIAAKTSARTRQGAYESAYTGDLLIVDAITNNPGSGGGVIVQGSGKWLGLIGKEKRDAQTGEWLNYALPISEIRNSVLDILSGKMIVEYESAATSKAAEPMTTAILGLKLIPEVVQRTPAFVDSVVPGSPAARAGVRPDDLIVEIAERMTPSIAALRTQLQQVDRDRTVKITIQRKQKFLTFEVTAN